MNELKLSKVKYAAYLPFVFYAAVLIVLHLNITINYGDDLFYAKVLNDRSLWEFIVKRYNTWSSRIIVDAVTVIVARFPLIWKLLDIACMLWIAVGISLCCNIERKTYVDWGIVIFLISFPFASMGTAGWIATTLNYSWCVAAGILALMPLRNILQEKATPIWLYVLATVALLYAVSQEQMCALMLGVCSVASVYLFCKNKQIPWYSLLQTAVSFGGIVFVLTCPGNSARLLENTEYWFPEFAEMSFLHKAELGYSRAMYEFIMKPNCVFSLFCAILLIAVVLYNKKAIYRIIALVPFVASVVLGEFSAIFDQVFPAFAILRKALTKTGTGIDLSSLKTLIPVLTVTFIALSVMISLYAVFGKTYTTLFLNYILLLGLATAWIMGFSPTVWASQERTFIFMYMSFIAVGAFVLNKIFENPQWKNTEILMWVLFTTQGLVLVDEYLLTVLK